MNKKACRGDVPLASHYPWRLDRLDK